MDYDSALRLSNFLGFVFGQDAVVITQPTSDGGSLGVHIGTFGKALTEAQSELVMKLAIEKGVDYSQRVNKDGFEFLFFADDSNMAEYEAAQAAFEKRIAEIAKEAGLEATGFNNRSDMNGASQYLEQGAEGTVHEGGWWKDGRGGPSDLFRRAVDNYIIPYASATGEEGYRFSPENFGQRFGLSREHVDYIVSKTLEMRTGGRVHLSAFVQTVCRASLSPLRRLVDELSTSTPLPCAV